MPITKERHHEITQMAKLFELELRRLHKLLARAEDASHQSPERAPELLVELAIEAASGIALGSPLAEASKTLDLELFRYKLTSKKNNRSKVRAERQRRAEGRQLQPLPAGPHEDRVIRELVEKTTRPELEAVQRLAEEQRRVERELRQMIAGQRQTLVESLPPDDPGDDPVPVGKRPSLI